MSLQRCPNLAAFLQGPVSINIADELVGLGYGARNGRVAWQFARDWVGRHA